MNLGHLLFPLPLPIPSYFNWLYAKWYQADTKEGMLLLPMLPWVWGTDSEQHPLPPCAYQPNILLFQSNQFFQDHCQPIAPSTDNSKSYFTSSQKHKNTRFPILDRFFYCFFTIFYIFVNNNNLLQNLVWSCRFNCQQNWAALSCH